MRNIIVGIIFSILFIATYPVSSFSQNDDAVGLDLDSSISDIATNLANKHIQLAEEA